MKDERIMGTDPKNTNRNCHAEAKPKHLLSLIHGPEPLGSSLEMLRCAQHDENAVKPARTHRAVSPPKGPAEADCSPQFGRMFPSSLSFTHLASLIALCGILFWASCKEKPDPIPATYENGILIVNEGNFQGGNGSLSFLDRAKDSLSLDIFKKANDRPLGDVAQSINIIGTKAYIVVNNSGKIEVVDLPTLKSTCTITGMTSPRYMLPISGNRALVTDLYSKTIHIISLGNCNVTGSIPTGGWTEEITQIGNRIFAAQAGTDKVLAIDATTLTLIDSIAIAQQPASFAQDKNGKLWILCSGNLGAGIPQLARLNPDSLTVEASFDFPSLNDAPSKLCINASQDTLYYLNGGIYRMAITEATLPTQPFIPAQNHNWYALDIDPQNGLLLAGNGRDFTRKGQILRFSRSTGMPIDSFEVGIIPGEFGFLD
jgi:hypothetical protein